MRTAMLLGVTALAAGLLAAGCGGDDGGAAPSKQDYIAEGDAICKQRQDEVSRQAQETFGGSVPTGEQIEAFGADVIVPSLDSQLEELRALTPPEGDEDTVGKIYDAVGDGIDAIRENPALVTDPNAGGTFAEADALAQRYGFKVCGAG